MGKNLPAVSNVVEAVVGRQHEEAGFVELRRHDDGDGLRHHQLVRQLRVQIHRRQKSRLARVSVNLQKKNGPLEFLRFSDDSENPSYSIQIIRDTFLALVLPRPRCDIYY